MDLQRLINTVVSSFERAPFAPEGEFTIEELSVLTALRETFLAAGVERLRESVEPSRWLQVGVEVDDADMLAGFLGGELRSRVEAWLAEGLAERFFFMNKPPGCRLRFLVPRRSPALPDQLFALLDEAKRAGTIRGWELGFYEPEVHQFGGEIGMELAHDYFTYDGLAVLRAHELARRDALTTDVALLSLLMVNDLVACVAGDRWEQWDVWCNMRLTGRRLDPDPERRALFLSQLDENGPALRRVLFEPRSVVDELSADEQQLLEAHFRDNRRFAARVREVEKSGALLYGMRRILPFYIVFHWNRLMLPLGLQASLVFYMTELLDPKR